MSGNRLGNGTWWAIGVLAAALLWGGAATGSVIHRLYDGFWGGDPGPGGAASAETPALEAGEVLPPGLTLSGPVVCAGSNDVRVERKYVKSGRDGVSVLGSCNVTIVDSMIVAAGDAVHVAGSGEVDLERTTIRGTVAVRLLGSGDVRVVDSDVKGTSNAFFVRGSGEVRLRGTRVEGGTDVRGSGGVVDEGS